jgi:sugar transferase (PEP-CTERM system associated)
MMRAFKHHVARQLLLLGVIEAALLAASAYGGLFVSRLRLEDLVVWSNAYLDDIVLFTATVIVCMVSTGLYNRQYGRGLADVIARFAVSCLVAGIALSVIFYVSPAAAIWRSAIAVAFGFAFVAITTARFVYLRVARTEALRRRIAVIGVGDKAARIEALLEHSDAYECVGYLGHDAERSAVASGPIVLGVNSVRLFVREHAVDEVIVALEERRGQLPLDELLACRMDGVSIVDFAAFWERETGRVDTDGASPSWLIFSEGFPGGPVLASLKRLFDVLGSLILLVVSFPLMVLTAIAIRLESRGPVFYSQERVGMNGRPFRLVKFRSMRVDAEEDGVPRWAQAEDPRVTRVGGFIRKTRLDETPQLINVLRGDMSVIGPRPERPYFVEEIARVVPYYFERHRVKPGISGWAQLNYPYGASTEDAKIKFEYDLYYLKNYSMLLDLFILLQTLRVIVWSEGAR